MPIGQALWVLAVQAGGYLLLAFYLDNVLPDDLGNRRGLLFFLHPSYWGFHWGSRHGEMARAKAALAASDTGGRVQGVGAEDLREEEEARQTRGSLSPAFVWGGEA